MITIEERIKIIVEANRGDERAMIYRIVHEIHLLHAALPAPAELESIADRLEVAGVPDVDSPDGTIFEASVFLRRAARLVRLAINEEAEDEETSQAASG